MLKREISEKLKLWRTQKNKKALCIIGARQIGKTTIIREFAKQEYENFIEINFILDKGAEKIFEDKLDADTIIENLTAFKMQKMEPGKTLVFLDEIQECPNARCAIKFLVEDGRFDYIESGSLLGVRYKEVPSYAVGFEEIVSMYPMNFREFLRANGVQDTTFTTLQFCYENHNEVPTVMHETLLKLFATYIVVGGMPECVMQFAETKDYILVRHTQDTILASYLNDMSKYNNLNEIKKTRLAYDNITVQLSKRNTRFQYKLIKKGGRAAEFENAIEWLCLSGIVSQVHKLEQVKKPLENYRDIDAFKIYVSDLGLLCAKKDLAANDILYMVEEINDFKGGMAENYVNVQLTINGYNTYYWESERGAEIDFIIQRDGRLIPIEVKSADNTRAKSLKVYMDTYKPDYAIKLSSKNFGFEDNKKIVPLYAAFCI